MNKTRKTRRDWSDAEDDQLRKLFAEGHKGQGLSNILHRNRGVVRQRLRELGLVSAKPVPGPRTDLPFVQTRKRDNATADACFRAAMGGRLFSIMATNDWGGIRVRRPERALGGGGSSLAFAAGRTRSEREEAAKP